MKHCKYYRTTHRYFDGVLSSQESNELERHLEGCDECRTLLAELRMLTDVFKRKQRVYPGPGLKERVSEALLKQSEIERNVLKNNTVVFLKRKLIPLAACFCVMLSGLTVYQAGHRNDRIEYDYVSETIQTESGVNDFSISFLGHLSENERAFVSGKDYQVIAKYYEITMAFNK